jgi:hypothetical protein
VFAVVWLVVGVVSVLAVPSTARRAGEKLTADEGPAAATEESA